MPSEDQFGPAMLRLTPLQRRFVVGLSVWGGNATEAARWAGYSSRSEQSLRVQAHQTIHLDYVKEAIKEEAWRRMDESALLAVSTVVQICMSSTDDKVRLAAAEKLLDRTGFHAKSEHTVTVKDGRTTQELVAFIEAAALRHGMDPNKLLGRQAPQLEVIDVEAEVVGSDDGIGDLL